jgi:hypothetical protein
MNRSYTPPQIADSILAGEVTRDSAFIPLAEVERLRAERDEARAEVARLLLGSEVLASHQGSLEREWHSGGAWLYAGDTINVVRAPLPEIEVVS